VSLWLRATAQRFDRRRDELARLSNSVGVDDDLPPLRDSPDLQVPIFAAASAAQRRDGSSECANLPRGRNPSLFHPAKETVVALSR
jgi:hypothetical protein